MSRRRQAWILLGCLAVLLLLVAVPLGYLAFLQARFNAAVAAYRAAGEPMSEAELGWPELADSDNIATGLAELVEQSVAMIPAEQRGWIDRMWEQPSGSAEDASSTEPLTEPQRQAARDRVLQLAPSAAEVDEVLARQAVRWPVLTDRALHLSLLGDIRRLASLLADDARLAAQGGDIPRFVSRVRQVHQIGTAVATDTSLIGHISGSGIQALAAHLVIDHPLPLGPSDTQELIRLLIAEAGRTERVTTALQVERVIVADQLITGFPPGTGILARMVQTFTLVDGPLALEQMDATRTALLATSAAEADAEVDRFATRAASMVTALASARVPQTILGNDRRLRTDQRLAAVALAIRAHYARHARNPVTLSELAPYGLPSDLTDPLDPSDLPLRWNPTTGVLYSVGRNRVDDGGDLTTPPNRVGVPSPWDFPDRGVRLPQDNVSPALR